MNLPVLNIDGENTGRQIELPEDVFGVEPNEHVVYLAVKQYNANQRQGTHKAKERGEIKGSTRKIKRQKGTGTARAGSIKNPLFRSGGRIFGPRPRNYTLKLNKKVKSLARKSVLADKYNNKEIVVVEDFTFENPKTQSFISILDKLGLSNERTLLMMKDYDKTIYLSSRNLRKTSTTIVTDMNVYEVLNAKTIILFEGAVEAIKDTF